MSASPSLDELNPKPSGKSLTTTRPGSRPRRFAAINGRTLRYTLLLGVITGFVFSTALWAYQTILLIRAHVAYPWIPFVVCSVFFMFTCTVAALLTLLVNRALLGIIIWVLAAWLIAELIIFIPLTIAPRLMIFFEPGLRSRLPAYPINATFRSWAVFATVGLAIFLGILGLVQLTLVDQAVPATSPAGHLTPYFVFIPVILLVSVMISEMVNQQLGAPLVTTNDLIQFAINHEHTIVDPLTARQMHLATVEPISDLINRPRKLFLGHYDASFSQVDVLIDFSGEWVDCTTVSLQPVFCEITKSP